MRELMGAILAGGQSTRMGRDKAAIVLRDGRRMMDAVGEALRQACGEFVIVGGTFAASNENEPSANSIARLPDLRAGLGPMGGIEALLASNLAKEYIVSPCDLPLLTADALRPLLQHRDTPATVMRFAGGPQFEPLPARLSMAALPVVRRLLDEGHRSVWRLMQALPAAVVDVDDQHALALRNVNTPEDLSTI